MADFDAWKRAAGGASDIWAASLVAPGPFPLQASRGALEMGLDPAARLPSSPRFWVRGGDGHPILFWLGLAHAAAGLFGAVAGLLVWNFVSPKQALPLIAALAGIGVMLAGAAVVAMTSSTRLDVALGARILLPSADFVASSIALWLLGSSSFAPLLFVIPITVAALLLSWRSGAIIATLVVVVFAAISALRLGAELEAWVPQTLAIAGVSTLLAVCAGIYSGQIVESVAALVRHGDYMREQRDSQRAEREHLLDGLNLLEETQARLEREHATLNGQMAELASIAVRMAEGDLGAARGLRSGMYGPLDVLAAALMRMTQQMTTVQSAHQYTHNQQRVLESIAAAVREQSHLLVAADDAVRDLGSSANELVAEVQVLGRGSGELPGIDRHVLFQAVRDVERHVIAQANDAAMLGARLAQLRNRQADLEAEVLRAGQLTGVPQSGDLVNRPGPTSFASSAIRPAEPAALPPMPAWQPPADASR
jgi:hypothetical protein